MARHGLKPDVVVCSIATRTRQTWELVAGALAAEPTVSYNDRLYEAGADAILALIRKSEPSTHALMLVGHNPGLHDVAQKLIAAGDIEARQRLAEKFPTGALAIIDFAFDDWRKLHLRSGRLDRFVAPRTLVAATD